MPRTFFVSSGAMEPTLRKDDKVLGAMRSFDPGQGGSRPLRRGDLILFNLGLHVYVKRVAALPGDRFEMIDGVAVLNGRRVPQRFLREEEHENPLGPSRARRLQEQFPGEPRPHEIYDMGYSEGDDFAQVRVPSGHVFVLGDNRDDSADSRFQRQEMGVGMLPIADVIGFARSIYLRPGEGLVDTPLTAD